MPASASLVPLGEGAVHWPEDRPPSQEGKCAAYIALIEPLWQVTIRYSRRRLALLYVELS